MHQLMGGEVHDIFAVNLDLALLWLDESVDSLKQGGLTHAVGAQDDRYICFAGLHVDPLQDIQIFIITDVKIFNLKHRFPPRLSKPQ